MSRAGTRVGIYVRVSTSEQSTELQHRELARYAHMRNWTEVTLYEDVGWSGTDIERPMLKNLLRDVRQRKLDIVLCWKLDRLFRSLKGLVITLQEFSELGVSFVSLKDNVDLSTSTGRLMTHIITAFAEFEASIIKERVRAGIANARANGVILGRPRKRVDAQILALHDQGLSVRLIAGRVGVSKSTVQAAITSVRKTRSSTSKIPE